MKRAKKKRPDRTRRAVHDNIRRLRDEKNLTQEELGCLVGAHKTVVSHWERGLASPRSQMLPAVAAALGVSVDELLGEAA